MNNNNLTGFVKQERTDFTNEKNTKNAPFVNGEFVGFAFNEQKKEYRKIFQEIIKNYPQVAGELEKILNENIELKKSNDELLEENIAFGELKEKLEIELKSNDINTLNNQIRELKAKLNLKNNEFKELYNVTLDNKKIFEEREKQYKILETENKQLKQKRGFFDIARDKGNNLILENENKELRSKLERVGRIPIADYKIKEIIAYYEQGLGYDKIAKLTGVSKTSVCKYVLRHIKGA